jgi:dTDP-4-dehydrorhamnose reductase
VKKAYGKSIEITPDDQLVIDRSLDSSRFRNETGWSPSPWVQLVDAMRRFG